MFARGRTERKRRLGQLVTMVKSSVAVLDVLPASSVPMIVAR
jgi:hypothetical protein